jgi:basic membrane lipoprotein Med (substrate-binding protein (PBP1-ABC) superfamily)
MAARFAVLARRGMEARGGRLIELRGDEALGVFASGRDALRAAVELQRLFRAGADDVPPLPLGVGIGLDAGEAVPVEDGFRGAALNLAARLCSVARTGEILASETFARLVGQVEGIRFVERGDRRFKGLDEPVHVFEVVSEEAMPPVPALRAASLRRFRRRHLTRRNAVLALLVAGVAAAVSAAGVAALGRGGGGVAGADATRVALVLPTDPTATGDDAYFGPFTQGLLAAQRAHDLETETIVVDEFGGREAAMRAAAPLREDSFDLVVWIGGNNAARAFLRSDALALDDTTFAFLDSAIVGRDVRGTDNALAVHFDDAEAGQLAGYLAALMATRRSGRPVISAIGGFADHGAVRALVDGYVLGARRAVPRIRVRVDYSNDFAIKSICEDIANKQIDAGSVVVFVPAGTCGLGGLAAAGVRGVWGIGVDGDRSHLGPHILASTYKAWAASVELLISRYLQGTLPAGEDLLLGLDDEAVGLVGISPDVPQTVRSRLAREAASLRADDS